MSIYSKAVQKPITTALIFVAIAIVGLFSFTRLSVDLMPDAETTDIMVLTNYNGASAEDIEMNISKVLENSLNRVDNLKHLTSKSQENLSIITLSFNAGTDIAEATNETRDKIDAVRTYLPDGASNPIIFKFGMKDIPVAILSVESKESSEGLQKILDNLVINPIARINGVGSVNTVGASERVIHVYCSNNKLEAYGLSLPQIAQIISLENKNIPAGQISVGTKSSSLRVQGEFRDPQDLRDIILSSHTGARVYLGDVAEIVDGSQEREQECYTNGKRGAMLMIKKQAGANAVAVSKEIQDLLPQIEKTLPKDIKIKYLIDTSSFIVNTLNNLGNTIAVTFIIVMLIVYIFLARRSATFIIVLTIPVSLIGAFIYLLVSDNTLNVISLSSLSIAIGMVVDDAIVVLENITQHIERGSLPKQAAVHATNEVGISVVASTLTMLAVFLPLTVVKGSVGIFFHQLGWIVSIVMIVSTLAALSLTPMLSSQLLKRTAKPKKTWKALRGFHNFLTQLEVKYAQSLAWSLKHRKTVIFGSIGLFILSTLLLPFVKKEFMAQGDSSFLMSKIELPIGTQVSETKAFGLMIENRLRQELKEIKIISLTVGETSNTTSNAMGSMNGTNGISYYISLVKPSERSLSQNEVAEKIRAIYAEYPEIYKSSVSSGTGNPNADNSDVSISIFGHNFNETDLIAKELKDKLIQEPACSEINLSRKPYTPEYRFIFDRKKLADNGLNISSASSALKMAVNGMTVSFYREDGDEHNIRLSLRKEDRKDLEDILKMQIPTQSGFVALSELGSIKESYTPPNIDRRDRSRVINIALTVANGYALSDLSQAVQKALNEVKFPSDISYKLGGSFEKQQETFGDLSLLLILIIILVYIVMAAQFESLSVPFVIMFSVPFAFTGVFLGLFITRIPMGTMAFIGLIMLVGIVVKNGIVLIDYIQLCRGRGMSISLSIVQSGQSRLRPVLMTTLTTVLGMVPMALGIGQGAETWQSMGVSVAFGLAVSTLITLILIPTIYASVEGFRFKKNRKLKAIGTKA